MGEEYNKKIKIYQLNLNGFTRMNQTNKQINESSSRNIHGYINTRRYALHNGLSEFSWPESGATSISTDINHNDLVYFI
jgi:hypothetical protein